MMALQKYSYNTILNILKWIVHSIIIVLYFEKHEEDGRQEGIKQVKTENISS